jgi:glyceraldehyde 3-phosphate dehydrogenase
MIKVAINGFGRIGRLTFRNLKAMEGIDVVAINDITDLDTLVHLLKYDSVHGQYAGEISTDGETITVDGDRINIYSERDPANLPWRENGVDVVLECTGIFRSRETAMKHIEAGASRVVISAPAKGDDVPTIVLGVNDDILTGESRVISNASCTTNCAAPMIKVVNDALGVTQGMLTTIHAYTGDQRIVDAPHSDLRRARAAAYSIIPTSTGAAKAVGLVIPELAGKLDGIAARVPIPSGSIVDLTVIVSKPTSAAEVNRLFREAAEGALKGYLEYSEAPLVSIDIVGNPHSCIFDSKLTMVSGTMVKLSGWYDNEMGYSTRLAEVCMKVGHLESAEA